MDFKQIQELIKMVNKSNIGEVSIEENGFKLTIKQREEPVQYVQSAPVQSVPAPAPAAPAPATQAAEPSRKEPAESTDHLLTITSPMIGTFYRSAAPGKPPFVEVGDEIQPGKVVCIIEAMKLFNEIESEIKGRIVKVLVDDASPVEYDQPLFLVDPS